MTDSDAKQFAANLMVLLDEEADEVSEDFNNQTVASVHTYREVGMLTDDAGLVVRMVDGSEFQLTVVKSRMGRD